MTASNGRAEDRGETYSRFRVGRGLAIVSPPTFLLVDPANGAFGERLWALMEGDGGIDELLEELSAAGLRNLGDFAMIQLEDDGVRVVVRGQAQAAIRSDGAVVPLEAGSVKSWVEAVFDRTTGFSLSIGEASNESLVYRMERGIAPADQLHWGDLHDDAPHLEQIDLGWLDDFEPTDVGRPRSETAIAEAPRGEPKTTERDGDQVMNPAKQQGEGDILEDDDYDFDALYGRTVAKTVQDAAVAAAVDETHSGPARDGEDADRDAPELPGESFDDGSAPTLAPPLHTADVPSLIDAVPQGSQQMLEESGTAVSRLSIESADESQLGDHDGMTVSAARLREIRQQSGSEQRSIGVAPPSGPMLQALVCGQGHSNPPQMEMCLRCREMLGGTPVMVPRPGLGRLVFSTGITVELDRPAIIGRNPKAEGIMRNEMPQLVRLEGQEHLSRSHAMIRLESWHVLVEDLGSQNGTIVTLPGRESRRLMAGEPVMLEPGAVVDFAGEVSAIYYGIE